MMKSSIKKRLRITRTGKVVRRIPGFNHFRAKKTSKAKRHGRKARGLAAKIDFNA